jgi:hypothetical protein
MDSEPIKDPAIAGPSADVNVSATYALGIAENMQISAHPSENISNTNIWPDWCSRMAADKHLGLFRFSMTQKE